MRSVERYLKTKPEDSRTVFASKLGWTVENLFTKTGFEVVYEVPNLDSILVKNNVDILGGLRGSVGEAIEVSTSFIGTLGVKQIKMYHKHLDGAGILDEGDIEPKAKINLGEEKASASEPAPAPEPEPEPKTDSEEPTENSGETYTMDYLTSLGMDELRDIGDKYGVKGVSKKGLSKEILQAIDNGVEPK